MNEFERALERTEKRQQRKMLAKAFEEPKQAPVEPQVIPVPKEKRPSLDAVINISVSLPYAQFDFSFTKANVMGMKRLSKNDFYKAISEGLKPILGNLR